MTRLRNIWALAAVSAASIGIALSLLLGGPLGTPAATGASATAVPEAVSAASIFGCRASVARVGLAGTTLAEPAIANGTAGSTAAPACADDSTLVQQVALAGSSSPLNFGSVGPAGAQTFETDAANGPDTPGATAVTNVTGLSLSFPGTTYKLTAAGPLESQVSAYCSGTTLVVAQPTADLDALTVTGPGLPSGGQPLELGGPLDSVVENLPAALSALITIKANEVTSTSTSTTARLLDITLLGSNAQIVVGEATVTYPGGANACSGNGPTNPTNGTTTTVTTPGTTTVVTEPTGSTPGGLNECTAGSTYDVADGDCVIYYDGQTIFVSLPFKGPQGGTAVALPVARKLYHSPCLSGAGPNYAYIVSKSHERALGSYLSDRILITGSHDYLDALAGNDCVDGIGTTQRIVDGNGNDRDYVTKGTNRVLVGNGRDLTTARGGNDRLISGNGPNTIHGGTGKDWITDGDGNDHIYASSQYTRIDAYGNEKHIYGGRAKDRIWTNSIRASISCVQHNGTTVYARKAILAYAAKHGCQVLKLLH